MKRKITVLLAVLTMLTAVTAGVYDPNSSHNYSDDKMHIMSGGSSAAATASDSGSGAETPDGTLWEAKLSMTNRSQNIEKTDVVENISFQDSADGEQTVTFTGYTTTPTPCHTVSHEVDEQNGTYVYTVKVDEPQEDRMCAQVISPVAYQGSFTTNAPYTLVVKHGETTIETLKSPQPENDTSEDNPANKQSIFAGFLNWLSNLL